MKGEGQGAYQCSFDLISDDLLAFALGCEFRQPEVGHFRDVFFVQQDVLRFDITVNDGRVGELVQVCQTPRGSHGDRQPLGPVE